jgi:predicted O-methyltransferase YrrM
LLPCRAQAVQNWSREGQLFEAELQKVKPLRALELGTFLGYSAVRTARNLQPGGRLLCVEANPQNSAVARQVVEYAGYGQQVQVVDGLSGQVIPRLPALLAGMQSSLPQDPVQQQQRQRQLQLSGFDFVFLDHAKGCYLPDLEALEQLGLVRQGTVVMADNVVYPGAPGE